MKALWKRVRPVVLVAWTVAAVRFALEFAVKPEKSEPAGFVSVYYFIAAAMVFIGLRSLWRDFGFRRLLGATAMIAVLCFLLPDAIVYTTGQFQGWTHGRFRPPAEGKATFDDRKASAAPVAKTPLGKLGTGLFVGALTMVGGFVWTTAFGLVCVYLPNRVRERRGKLRPSGPGATP